jgi:hypothetical protein
MKISKKTENYRIYVEDEKGNFISTNFIREAESFIDKLIPIKVTLKDRDTFSMELTREEIEALAYLFIEVNTYL